MFLYQYVPTHRLFLFIQRSRFSINFNTKSLYLRCTAAVYIEVHTILPFSLIHDIYIHIVHTTQYTHY